MNDTARIRNATSPARSTGSRGRPRNFFPAVPPFPFGILILILTISALLTVLPFLRVRSWISAVFFQTR